MEEEGRGGTTQRSYEGWFKKIKKRPVPNATRWGAFMFDSWMIPSGGGFLYWMEAVIISVGFMRKETFRDRWLMGFWATALFHQYIIWVNSTCFLQFNWLVIPKVAFCSTAPLKTPKSNRRWTFVFLLHRRFLSIDLPTKQNKNLRHSESYSNKSQIRGL